MLSGIITVLGSLAVNGAALPGQLKDPADHRDFGQVLDRREDTSAQYGYHGHNGPLGWHELSPNNSLCARGQNQSPINVKPGEQDMIGGPLIHFRLDSRPEGTKFENTGHTVQVAINGSVLFNNQIYHISQFHFHTPSEHHFADEHFASEVHFVAETKSGSIAVIALFVELALACEPVSDLLKATLGHVGKLSRPGDSTSTSAIKTEGIENHIFRSNIYQYSGSLTTPPCKEGVLFNVVDKPLYIGVSHYRSLKTVVKFNSRYIQNTPGQYNLLSPHV